MKTLTCNFKNITAEDKAKFKVSQCLLTISVGQESHEDKRFIATMDLIGSIFASCTIAVHDTLQRHTIAISQNGDAKNFYSTALSSGDKWLERNKRYYSAFANRIKIIRWDEWLNDVDFSNKKAMILAELNRDKKYRELFNESINEYLNRYYKRLKKPELLDRERAEQLCLDYLLEECAVLCLWPKTGCHFEIYAGTHNAAMEETRKRFVYTAFPKLVNSVSIGFNHRPNLKPQNFNLLKTEIYEL